MIRDTAREFAQRQLAPHALAWETSATFPRGALRIFVSTDGRAL